jgi:hypothetical protein
MPRDLGGISAEEPVHGVELVRAELAGEADGDVRIEPPVEQAFSLGGAGRGAPGHLLVVLSPHGDDVAHGVGAGEGAGELVDGIRSVLEADLDDGLGVARGGDDGLAVFNGVRERRFAVDVLAGLDRINGDGFVRMGRGWR